MKYGFFILILFLLISFSREQEERHGKYAQLEFLDSIIRTIKEFPFGVVLEIKRLNIVVLIVYVAVRFLSLWSRSSTPYNSHGCLYTSTFATIRRSGKDWGNRLYNRRWPSMIMFGAKTYS